MSTTALDADQIVVTVDIQDLETAVGEGSVIRVTGTSQDDPTQRIHFAGDTRSMVGLLAMVEGEGEVTAVIEPWQVISTWTAEPS